MTKRSPSFLRLQSKGFPMSRVSLRGARSPAHALGTMVSSRSLPAFLKKIALAPRRPRNFHRCWASGLRNANLSSLYVALDGWAQSGLVFTCFTRAFLQVSASGPEAKRF